MLTIRESQMEVFRDARRRTFEDSLFSQIARKFPAELDHLSESGLRSLMQRSLSRAAAYGFRKETHVVRFVEWSVELGERFERLPQCVATVQSILDHPTLPGAAKFSGIFALVQEASGGRTLRVIR